MNVSLTPELDSYVHGKVESGRYTSASEVVRESLRLMQERDEAHEAYVREVRAKIQEGEDALARGDYIEGTAAEIRDELLRRSREALKNRNKQSA